MVLTVDDELAFQRYFVERHCEPPVRGFRFEGIEAARPADGVLEALAAADAIVLCPSNPWVSLDPILAVPGLRPALGGKVVIGVSPIIGGRALKGPAAKMARELGIEPSAGAIAEHYRGVLTGLVIDELDVADVPRVEAAGIRGMTAHTVMKRRADRRRLANDVLGFARQLAG
jgi:LPPG:FO 2-phospho-L-lactate transferase